MNYLAHIFLSFENEPILVGNFMADFCRNKDLEDLPNDILNGIYLHRSIDSFTDNHPNFLRSTEKFYENHGKYASVLTDMVYDVFLILNWSRFADETLQVFVDRTYPILKKNEKHMPFKLQSKLDKMIEANFLARYQSREGLQKALNYMDRRTKFPSKFHAAILDIDKHEEELNEEFLNFFPELITFVKKELQKYQPSK